MGYANTQGLVFLIDSGDYERMSDVKEDDLRGIPFLFVANKQDLAKAMSVEEILEKLELHHIKDRQWCE